MLREAAAAGGAGDSGGSGTDSDERRRSPRRKLPFGSGAVLQVDGTNHIVAVVDLSATGAYLSTRVAVSEGQSLSLKLFLIRGGIEVTLPCELVRVTQQRDGSGHRLPGVAVRFREVDAATLRQLETFTFAARRHRARD